MLDATLQLVELGATRLGVLVEIEFTDPCVAGN